MTHPIETGPRLIDDSKTIYEEFSKELSRVEWELHQLADHAVAYDELRRASLHVIERLEEFVSLYAEAMK
jgi:hypothetical protein